MPLPQPVPALVLHYAYLWRDEHRRGHEEGIKDRPCVIVAVREAQPGELMVMVAPITHRPPAMPHAVELPPATKRRLGLDDQPSWIVADEHNRFRWPGHDVRPIPGRKPIAHAYGILPPGLFRQVTAAILAGARAAKISRFRDEDGGRPWMPNWPIGAFPGLRRRSPPSSVARRIAARIRQPRPGSRTVKNKIGSPGGPPNLLLDRRFRFRLCRVSSGCPWAAMSAAGRQRRRGVPS